MTPSKLPRCAATFAVVVMTAAAACLAAPARAFDLDQLGQDLQAGSDFLAKQRWGQPTPPAPAQGGTAIRNETHKAFAGWEKEVGVRWAIDHDCRPRQFTVTVVQPPRFGRVHIRPVNMMIPAQALNAGTQGTMQRCAGLPTIGQGIYYTAPKGRGHYYDHFAVQTSTGLRFNYKIQVEKPKG